MPPSRQEEVSPHLVVSTLPQKKGALLCKSGPSKVIRRRCFNIYKIKDATERGADCVGIPALSLFFIEALLRLQRSL